jgi:hypothetical protein
MKYILSRFRTLFSNCGGRNYRIERYAGRLVGQLSEGEFIAICHCLIFHNGTRKTTERNRNTNLIVEKLPPFLGDFPEEIEVLDVGSSIGLDSISTIDWLSRQFKLNRYVLGDLFTEIIVDESGRFVADQDGRILQTLSSGYFTSMNFSFQYRIQKVIHFWNYLRTKSLRSGAARRPGSDARVISLLAPDLREPQYAFVSAERLNVFVEIERKYDLLICMNLLVPRYFDAKQISIGIENLRKALKPGGVLIVGANDGGVVWKRDDVGNFSAVDQW